MIPFPAGIERLVDSIYPPARQAQAEALAAIVRPLYFVAALYQLALLAALYCSGAAVWLRAGLERVTRVPWLLGAGFAIAAVSAFGIALLPLAWYEGYALTHAFGLSRESALLWFRDWAVALALTVAVSALVAAFFIGAVRRFGRSWPVVAAVAAAPLILFANAVFPVYVAPLFNRYTELRPSPLTRSILSLAISQGLDASVVYEYDMSRQTNEGNAYVAGIGKTERIAIGDTLLRSLKPDEVLYVVAHEIGHYKLGHLWLGSLYAWLGALAAILLVELVGGALASGDPRLSSGLGDPAALALVGALLLVFNFITMPVANALSRNIEGAADAFAAAHTHLGAAGVRAFARLGTENLTPMHPPAIVVWFFYTHPPLDKRIMAAAGAEGPQRSGAP